MHDNVRRKVYEMIFHQLLKFNGYVYRINGTRDHIHILVSLPAKHSVSEVIKIVKQEVSKEITKNWIISEWEGWEEGYSSFTFSYRELEMLKNYVINQEEHHKNMKFIDELREWLILNGVSEEDPRFPK